jgi:hypothetical protein
MADDEDAHRRDRRLAHELTSQQRPVPLLGQQVEKPRTRWRRFSHGSVRALEVLATPASVLVAAVALIVTSANSQEQLRADGEQFERTLREGQYADIVDGLGSSSVGVQVGSIRRLVRYVDDPGNFEDEQARDLAVSDAAQILSVFIQDESAVAQEGLTDYRDPQPIVASRAVGALVDLAEDPDSSRFPLDLNRGNFHGNYLPDVELEGQITAVGADFRRATVTGWDLTHTTSVNLTAAFFTCADLRVSALGSADVASADFTGADLRGADLSQVTNLTSEQLSGALVGPRTRLPTGVKGPRRAWGVQADEDGGPTVKCLDMVDAMTGLVAGAGYSARFPCPDDPDASEVVRLSRARQEVVARVCTWRSRPAAGEVVRID